MAKVRDPREDPQPKDVIRRQGRRSTYLVRTVITRHHEQISYRSGDSVKIRTVFLANWIEWAREADDPRLPSTQLDYK